MCELLKGGLNAVLEEIPRKINDGRNEPVQVARIQEASHYIHVYNGKEMNDLSQHEKLR